MKDRSVLSPAEQLQQMVNTLVVENEALVQDLENQQKKDKLYEQQIDELKDKLEAKRSRIKMEVIDLEQRNRDLAYDVERYKRTAFELEDRIEQQKAVKDNLRRKVKDNEENLMVMTKELNKCKHENQEA